MSEDGKKDEKDEADLVEKPLNDGDIQDEFGDDLSDIDDEKLEQMFSEQVEGKKEDAEPDDDETDADNDTKDVDDPTVDDTDDASDDSDDQDESKPFLSVDGVDLTDQQAKELVAYAIKAKEESNESGYIESKQVIHALNDNNISKDDINILIGAMKGDKSAIKAIINKSGVDQDSLLDDDSLFDDKDEEGDDNKGFNQDYLPSKQSIVLNQHVSQLSQKSPENFKKIRDFMSNADSESSDFVVNNPETLQVMSNLIDEGVHDEAVNVMKRGYALGFGMKSSTKPLVKRYEEAVAIVYAERKEKEKSASKKSSGSGSGQRRKKAGSSSSNRSSGSQRVLDNAMTEADVYDLSDEKLDKLYRKY